MDEDIERLNRIYGDLKQQYDDKSSPLMILSDIDADDLSICAVMWVKYAGHTCTDWIAAECFLPV
ncbi:hypothetical protein [Methanomethylophilus alvi]|uniref:hypothetical protein n=1 Tax=Methanomethylophilus alvi TaxID=1291540 RepID=UPI0037DC5578